MKLNSICKKMIVGLATVAIVSGYVPTISNIVMAETIQGDTTKEIEIPDIIKEDLYTYALHEQITSGIIFRTSNGSPVDRSNFRKDIRKLCVLAGIEEGFYSIQHIKHVVLDEYPYYRLNK